MLVLHWVMMAMEAQWAAIYHIGDKGLYRVAKSSSAAKGGQTLFDFLGDTPETDMAMSLAARAMRMRTIVATSARSPPGIPDARLAEQLLPSLRRRRRAAAGTGRVLLQPGVHVCCGRHK